MSEPVKMNKPLWRRVLRKAVFIIVVLVVLTVTGIAVWNYRLNRQIRNEIAKIRAAGEPVTFQDLEARQPKIDDAHNAARFYLAGMKLIVAQLGEQDIGTLYHALGESVKNSPAGRPDPAITAQAKQFIDANQKSLALFDQGAELPACRDVLWIKSGMESTLVKLKEPREAAKLLSVRTRYLAAEGRGDAAVDSVIASFRLARILDDQAVLIAYLVKIACRTLAYDDVRIVLEIGHPSDKALVRLQGELAAVEDLDGFSQTLLGERAYGIELQVNDYADQNNTPPPPLDREQFKRIKHSPFIKKMTVGYLRDLAAMVEVSKTPWPGVYNDIQALKPRSIFGGMLTPAYQRVLVQVGRSLAQNRSLQVAVAVERFRRARGKLPEKLADLVPAYLAALAQDPFTGTDLRYRRDKDAYTIYSFGDDRTDDGGLVDRQPAGARAMGPGARPPQSQSRPAEKSAQDWGVKIRILP